MSIELSVIIPFCNEVPQVVFTIQNVIEELDGWCDFEVIVVDNQSDWYVQCKLKNEHMPRMQGKERTFPVRQRAFFQAPPGSKNDGGTIGTMFFRKGIVKYIQYDDKLGHWNAKNAGIAASSGKFIMFLDAHCIMNRDGIRSMVEFVRDPPEKIGGVHAYINYMLDSRSLEYRVERSKFFGYKFCTHQMEPYRENGSYKMRFPTQPYKVCVMSTCGMMSPRTVIEELGGWHKEFGIYCGGEGYMNFKQSTCGYHHWIQPRAKCWHWAEKRGYQWWHSDFVRNEFIAAYINGGEAALEYCVKGRKSSTGAMTLAEDVLDVCEEERAFVRDRQVETLDDYFERWSAAPGIWWNSFKGKTAEEIALIIDSVEQNQGATHDSDIG